MSRRNIATMIMASAGCFVVRGCEGEGEDAGAGESGAAGGCDRIQAREQQMISI